MDITQCQGVTGPVTLSVRAAGEQLAYLATPGAGRVPAGSGASAVVRSRDRYTVGLLTLNRAAISAAL